MNSDQLLQLVSQLNAIKNDLPDSDVDESYIDYYHQTLTEFQTVTTKDFSRFFIPSSELKYREVGRMRGPVLRNQSRPTSRRDEERYCPRERFLMSISAAINYLNALVYDTKCPSCGTPITFSWLRA
jgi:hypothetical protein